ncbi:hypothetical protein B0J13DRAFT_136488 [Dactylonectria estremocensis]|uniref:Uncharacterized protein n=1 Tax=Dactylonectria estremocensis TaxID=1079267 RepID=A0A9P9E3M9_9HYPO|nr:hypothetical protein B0J13DRAFT_136488 [Dactylonectria estremocensis]
MQRHDASCSIMLGPLDATSLRSRGLGHLYTVTIRSTRGSSGARYVPDPVPLQWEVSRILVLTLHQHGLGAGRCAGRRRAKGFYLLLATFCVWASAASTALEKHTRRHSRFSSVDQPVEASSNAGAALVVDEIHDMASMGRWRGDLDDDVPLLVDRPSFGGRLARGVMSWEANCDAPATCQAESAADTIHDVEDVADKSRLKRLEGLTSPLARHQSCTRPNPSCCPRTGDAHHQLPSEEEKHTSVAADPGTINAP